MLSRSNRTAPPRLSSERRSRGASLDTQGCGHPTLNLILRLGRAWMISLLFSKTLAMVHTSFVASHCAARARLT